jgi:large repetitive protein
MNSSKARVLVLMALLTTSACGGPSTSSATRASAHPSSRPPLASPTTVALPAQPPTSTAPAVEAHVAGTFSPTGVMSVDRDGGTATLLRDGRVLLAGGSYEGNVLASAELYDPMTGHFRPTGSMNSARARGAAVLLRDGTVLLVGGNNGGTSAETYDPATGLFTPTGALSIDRVGLTATGLNDGRVLVAGGHAPDDSWPTSAEIYDPATRAFSSGGSIDAGREDAAAALLADGRVLIAGGLNGHCGMCGDLNIFSSAEVFDPDTTTFSSAGPMNADRYRFNATVLRDGSVLMTGGTGDRSTETYNPATDTFSPTGPMLDADGGTATLLGDGSVLIAGSQTGELYDPATRSFAATSAEGRKRSHPTATLLSDGTVLVAGGGNFGSTGAAQLYWPVDTTRNPLTPAPEDVRWPDLRGGSFRTAPSMSLPRAGGTAVSLLDGSAFMVGDCLSGTMGLSDTSEIYSPYSGAVVQGPRMVHARCGETVSVLRDGRVLVAGGGPISAEVFDPAAGTFVGTRNTTDGPREFASAVTLVDGRVLIVGGQRAGSPIASAEIYDPETEAFSSTGSMATARFGATLTLLATGTVLVLGGVGSTGQVLASAELYDPGTANFRPAGSLKSPRSHFAAMLLRDGRVLIAGGRDVNVAEIYDPQTGTFSTTGSMGSVRQDPITALLPDGRVLVLGGGDNSAEIYDPALGTFTPDGSIPTWRYAPISLDMSDGRILIAGGLGLNGLPLSTIDIYWP